MAAGLPPDMRRSLMSGQKVGKAHFVIAAAAIMALTFGGFLTLSAQAQTSPAAKTTQPALALSPPAGNSPGNVASSNPKPALPTEQPAASGPAMHPDVKATAPAPAPKDKVDDSYIVGIADGLYISVWKEQDLSGAVVVRPDGMITIPVVGDVHVAGLTTPQVQELLTSKLKDVVAEPQVTVIVRDIRSRKVYLVGKVGRPGAVSLTSPETVLQLLAEAGGPSQLAKPQKMYILRNDGDKQKRIDFNYKKALAGTQPDVDVMVGDIVVVP